MSRADHDLIRASVERRIAGVEPFIPSRPTWRSAGDQDLRRAHVQVVAGPALRPGPPIDRRFGLLVAVGAVVVLMVVSALAGVGGPPSSSLFEPIPSPSATASPRPTEAGWLRPAVEPRLSIPVRPKTAWTIVEDGVSSLDLAYFLDEVGSTGYNVGLTVFEPHGVYDPVLEGRRLPLPADLMGWIKDHPDVDAAEPVELTVAGLAATSIDVTVTYESGGPKGETAQFIDDGIGSRNLEAPNRKRIVLVELPHRPLLMVFDSRPEFFDASISRFEDVLRSIQFEDRGPSP
jgi:hypothetical protein